MFFVFSFQTWNISKAMLTEAWKRRRGCSLKAQYGKQRCETIMGNLGPLKTVSAFLVLNSFCLILSSQLWCRCSTPAEVKRKKEEEKKKEASLSNRQRVELFKKVTATSLCWKLQGCRSKTNPEIFFSLCSSSFGMKYISESWHSCRGFY